MMMWGLFGCCCLKNEGVRRETQKYGFLSPWIISKKKKKCLAELSHRSFVGFCLSPFSTSSTLYAPLSVNAERQVSTTQEPTHAQAAQ